VCFQTATNERLGVAAAATTTNWSPHDRAARVLPAFSRAAEAVKFGSLVSLSLRVSTPVTFHFQLLCVVQTGRNSEGVALFFFKKVLSEQLSCLRPLTLDYSIAPL
jgi:hypothetical protein